MSNFDYHRLSKRLATPFSISDTARQAAKLLGDDWHAESGYWGVTGEITTLDGARFIVGVDHEGDLYVYADKRPSPRRRDVVRTAPAAVRAAGTTAGGVVTTSAWSSSASRGSRW
ncbi:hypothetical protein [Streptomyces enissocaesilis]|uniref:Uncharacterized protein n=1 Tax=Streptomyces enissocaesilis TaxID=332589 RepID=A0ABP6K6M8_9ACTN